MSTVISSDADYIAATIEMAKSNREDLIFIDEMMQVYKRIEAAVKENKLIQNNNLFFHIFQTTHADSLMIRLRRLVDGDHRSASLQKVATRIAKRPSAFTREWHASIYKGTTVESLEPEWWGKYADSTGRQLCPGKVQGDVDALKQKVKKCCDWISQNVAHQDENRAAPAPTWTELYEAIEEVRLFFQKTYVLLTGHSDDCKVSIAVDWEVCLAVPWIEPNPRMKIILKNRRKKLGIPEDPK